MVEFSMGREELELVKQIAERVEELTAAMQIEGMQYDRHELVMDLDAAYTSAGPVNLTRLLESPDADFLHDIYGIRRHIDRASGELTGCFMPRCGR
jgi:hypothetical protein